MIYCVEDDSSIRELMVYTLQASGFEACGFQDAAAFWDMMKEKKPELVILDIMLPGEDGISILKKLRTSPVTEEIPVIMATAKDSEYDTVIGLDSGADDYQLDKIVEDSLRGAAIWEEVKDRLKKSALSLSGGQQQRICIARALAVEPEILLMDEPTSALDPISTTKIEDLMDELKKKYTVIVVTHNMQQAVRVSDYTAFFLVGDMVEYGETKQIFSYPKDKRTEDYITGRFG